MIPLMNLKKQYASIAKDADEAVLDVLHSAQYIMGKNVKEFEKLFSQNSKKDIEDINKQISSFFEFIDGDIQEYSGDCASSSENNNGNKRIELDGMYHISTSKNEYYLNFYMVYKADDVPSDIGLSKIEIATEQTVNRENFMWDTSENGIFVVRE